MNKSRFEAFTDGVFAFAITLLILGIVLPAMRDPSERELRHAILSLWPNFIAFALSFAVIGIMWQNHHALFRFVARIDRKTIALNLMLQHLIASGAFEASVTPERLARTVVAYRVGWFTYVAAALLALVLPALSFAAYLAIRFYYYIPRGVDADVA
jgi:uncharacterized membrane protein